MSRRPAVLVILLTGGLLSGCGGAPSPDAGATPPTSTALPSGLVMLEPLPGEPTIVDLGDQFEGLQGPVPSIDVYDFTGRLQVVAGDSPDNGGTALGDDGVSLTLYWFGSVPDQVLDLVAEYEDRVQVEVVATPLRPGDLRAEARRLVAEHAPTVQGAGPRPQGDGVVVPLATAAVDRAGSIEAVLAELDSSVPLFVEVGDIVPA